MHINVENINSHGGGGNFHCLKLEMNYYVRPNHRTLTFYFRVKFVLL